MREGVRALSFLTTISIRGELPMPRVAFIFLAVLLASNIASAQIRSSPSTIPRAINGEVRLPNDRAAGIGLYVTLESDGSGGFANTQTDSRGKFSFPGLANARYRVKVHAIGYQDETQEVDL